MPTGTGTGSFVLWNCWLCCWHNDSLVQAGSLVSLSRACLGRQHETGVILHGHFECSHPTLQGRCLALQKLLRCSPGHMWLSYPGVIWDVLCLFLQLGTSDLGSSPCTAHNGLGAPSGRAHERQSLWGSVGGFWMWLLSGQFHNPCT